MAGWLVMTGDRLVGWLLRECGGPGGAPFFFLFKGTAKQSQESLFTQATILFL